MRRSIARQIMGRKSAYPFKLSLLGVPEQVNIPIQLCQEQGIFSKYGVEVDYTTVPEGTGAMLKKLHHNEADLAITVTDGFIAGQAAGFNVQLVGTYVDSPLTWAVSAHPDSPFDTVEQLFHERDTVNIGISRLQSGSHTMSYYMADLIDKQKKSNNTSVANGTTAQDLQKNQLEFKVLGSFANLRDGVKKNDIDIFLWEVFTTKPYFDSGVLKYIGEVSTPWPAFSIVASNSGHFLCGEDNRATDMYRHRFLPALAEGISFFKDNLSVNDDSDGRKRSAKLLDGNATCDDSVTLIMQRFGHKQADAQAWLDKTQYAPQDMSVDVERMRRALQTLQGVGLVPEVYPVRRLWGGDDTKLCNEAISFRDFSALATMFHADQNELTQHHVSHALLH